MAAVRGGLLSLNEALDRYSLSLEEYLSWHRQSDQFGLEGLRVNSPRPRPQNRDRADDGNSQDERPRREATHRSSATG